MTKYRLEQIGKIVGGGTPSTKKPQYYTNKGISWITPKDLSGYSKMYISHGARDISKEGLENSSAKLLPKSTVLVSSRAPIGYVALAANEIATNQGFKSIVPDVSKVLPKYLYYLMLTKKEELESISSGSTFKEISGKVMKKFEVDIPVISKQKEIIHKVDPVIKKIELNNQINANLLDFALSYFDSIQKEKFVKLQEILEVRDGTHDSPKQKSFGFPLVTSKAIKGNSIDFSQTKLISQNDFENINKRSKVETNDILVSMIGTVGIIYKVIEAPVDFAIKNVGLIKSGNHQELANIVYLHLISKAGQDYINSHLSGSTQQFISLTNLRNLPIPTLDNFTNIQIDSIKKIFLMITQNSKQNFILKKIKKELLSKFF